MKIDLSHDVAVISVEYVLLRKSYDHTCNMTLARTRNVSENVCVKMRFLIEIMFILMR